MIELNNETLPAENIRLHDEKSFLRNTPDGETVKAWVYYHGQVWRLELKKRLGVYLVEIGSREETFCDEDLHEDRLTCIRRAIDDVSNNIKAEAQRVSNLAMMLED